MAQTQRLDGRQRGIRENDGECNESFVFPLEGRVAVEKQTLNPSLLQMLVFPGQAKGKSTAER